MRDRASDLPIRFERVTFKAHTAPILQDISLELTPGPPTILMGPNGSGKTTLLKLAMGLLTASAGRITHGGRTASRSGRRAFVFQKPVMLRRTATANVTFSLRSAGRAADLKTAGDLLRQVGLEPLADRPARRLSGGEQQRLALARALAREPEVLILDEPTASLDPAATKSVEDIVERIALSGVKVVMATHDMGQARRLAGDIVFLARGRVLEHAGAPDFFAQPATVEARRFLAGDLVI